MNVLGLYEGRVVEGQILQGILNYKKESNFSIKHFAPPFVKATCCASALLMFTLGLH